jgi:DNA-binding response OmpR family regulator
LVLMDLRLAGALDGIAAAQQIAQVRDVPIIFLTAHSDPETLARACLTGPFGYILKPFNERELHTQIEIALYRHGAERRVRESEAQLRAS